MKKGFTLVELSIVLVIIGLLIGGILVGQSLINAAKTRAMISNFQQYEVAVQQFGVKFKQMPGDSNRVAPVGNNDRVINWGSTGCSGLLGLHESYQLWYHLSATEMIKLKLASYSPPACGGPHVNEWAKSAGIYVPIFNKDANYARDYLGQGFDTDKIGIIYMFNYFSTYAQYDDLIGIDNKLDDGNPATGALRSGDDIDGTACTQVATNSPQHRSRLMCELNYTKNFIF